MPSQAHVLNIVQPQADDHAAESGERSADQDVAERSIKISTLNAPAPDDDQNRH
jgi:hypothetical protein